MPNRAGTIERLALELSRALESVSELIKPGIVNELGFQLPLGIFDNPTLVQSFDALSTQIAGLPVMARNLTEAIEADDIPQIILSGIQLTQKLTATFNAIEDVASELSNLAGGLPPDDQAEFIAFADSFPRKLLDYCVITYLESRSKLAVHGLVVIGLFEWKREGVEFETNQHTRKTIRFDHLSRIISNPIELYREIYGWGDAAFDTARLFETLRNVIEEGTGGTIDIVRLDEAEPVFEAYLFALQRNSTLNPPGLNLEVRLPLEDGVTFTEVDAFAFPWTNKLNIQIAAPSSNLPATITPPLDIDFPTGSGNVTVNISSDLSTAQATEPFTLIGITGASRIEARTFGITVGAQGDAASGGSIKVNPSFGLRLEGASVNLDFSASDSFIQTAVSKKDVNSSFNLAATWSMNQGLQLQGSGGIEINLPAHVDLGIAKLNNLFFKLTFNEEFELEASAGITAKLGPLTATITRIGLIANFKSANRIGGNLGPIDVSFSFKAPSGIGLSVDGGGFKGGGFLEFEPEEARYSGMLELEFQNQFTLKAFGLLNTRLPNGQSGFSLLIVISSEFTPIQLGLGFKLNGVGGILGLNRTVNIEPLRAGLRDNTLSSILFPTDIVANADRIISDLRQVFPPAAGRFVFGPMAKITWGTPTLITADLGLVIEIPEPVRLVLLGVLRAVLPDEAAPILRLQVNFLGELNFERRQLKFDASLFDSKLLGFTLSGDMALRLDFGADKNLLLTVGGFHPAFQPPMDLPAIRRLTLALLDGDNPRLKLEMYFAVTSNTAQFGAKLELYAAAWKFNVYGFLTFDVLFQFNPFYFIAEITAMLALRVGSSSFASIKLSLTLEGPTPWKAQGTAKFKICWFFTLKVRFNKTFGESRNTTLPDVAVLPLLVAAFEANDNWESELPPERHRLESIREETPGQLLVHTVGTLKVSQKVAPLNVRIDRLGGQRPSDAREFQLTDVQPEASPEKVQEAFAPAQFFDMSDEQKLTSASFKQFDSGVRIGDATRVHTGYAAAREVKYELKYIDSQREQEQPVKAPDLFDVDPLSFNTWTLQGAIAASPLSFARNRKSSLAPEAVAVTQEPFAIVNAGDLQLFDESSVLDSEQAAAARLTVLLEQNPHLRGTLQVVPAFERAA